jgi:hypothetical protein
MKKSIYLVILFLFSYLNSYSQVPKCGTGGLKEIKQTVTGLPEARLTNKFGLLSVTVGATIPGKMSDYQPYMVLIAPGGQQFRLMDGQSFPQFDGTNQAFKVTFSACNSGGIHFLTSPFNSKSYPATIQSYPNPFTDVWNLDIRLGTPDKLTIEITDLRQVTEKNGYPYGVLNPPYLHQRSRFPWVDQL